jgi:hypothetical protein
MWPGKLIEGRVGSCHLKGTSMKDRMRRIMQCRTTVCAVVLCFAAAVGAQTTEWKSYSYPADGFQASYPSVPEMTKKDIPTDAGSFELRSYIAQASPVALFIGVCDYGSKVAGTDPQTVLQGTKNGALANSSSHLVSERKIKLGVYPGIEYEAESDAAHFTARIYIVGSVLYQTLVVVPLGKPYDDTTRFLDSFQLIARTSN